MTDRQTLLALALRDDKLTMKQIAHVMGVTKGTVSGVLFRIDRDLAASEVGA